MFLNLGRFAFRRRWWIVGAWLLVLAVALPILPRVEDPLKVGGFSSPNTEAAKARTLAEENLEFSPSQIVIIFQSDRVSAEDPRFQRQVRTVVERVRDFPNVTTMVFPDENDSLISADSTTAYALVGLSLPPEEAQRGVESFREMLGDPGPLKMLVAGGPAFYADIELVSQRDLRRAELIAFPFAMIALVLVFGSIVAAGVPLAVGGLGVAAVLVALYALAHVLDISIFALNLATMLGLGLAVDYSLFITSRFREEMKRIPGDVGGAVERTISTAGRAIFFSGLTVLIGLMGLVFFKFMFLRSVGVAGVFVVFFSVLSALTLVPAVLSILGTRIDRGTIIRQRVGDSATDHGFWVSLSRRVMAHPFLVLIPTLGFLVLLGSPFARVQISSPDVTILPVDLPSRQGFDVLVNEYDAGAITPFVVVLQSGSSMRSSENLRAVFDLASWLGQQPHVTRVESALTYGDATTPEQAMALLGIRGGLDQAGVDTRLGTFLSDDTAMILAYTDGNANAPFNKDLLQDIRAQSPGGDLTMLVDGGTAEIVDVVDAIYSAFPKAALLIIVLTYLILMVLFRSLLLPLKAILMNTLSILASYGALVWFFQDGNFSGVLDFTPLGFVEASLPVIMFCVLFGLSMDYEVFLLSRVKEEWELTGDNQHSVAVGLQRSGRIITSAALIVVVVTASFVSADVILIKALGLGIAIAVFLDATIVRALLVPATMRLMGKWNWWLPDWLDRLLPSGDFTKE